MGEGDPIPVVRTDNPAIKVELDVKDLSLGKARYRGAKPVSPNLSMKPTLPGLPPNPIAHANVEVRMVDEHGKPAAMTRRSVRYWLVRPLPGATVEDLSRWQVVGLGPSEFLPFAPSGGERPASLSFEWDRPGAEDAPGVQGVSVKDSPFGQLQEFMVGNEKVGGAYYQVYVLWDGHKTRVITSGPMMMSAADYRAALRFIDNPNYAKTMGDKLYFMPGGGTDNTTMVPTK